jgi:hypothetical protein
MTKYTKYPSYGKFSKFNSKKNYSSFWMDDDSDYYATSKFAGMGATKRSASDDIVKVIKLASYQRAIANFVKILTKKNIPVIFKGDTSYTDFESVVLSTDIKDNNFDVSVGLALHEGSHILLTDPNYLNKMYIGDGSFKYHGTSGYWDFWKSLVNWIEDRRIDNFVFKTSPGYKAYYHKMYDYYWNDKSITAGLLSSNYRDATKFDAWFFRIVNSLNPASQPSALPGLDEILKLIDTPRISRLTSVQEVGDIATKVLDIILESAKDAKDEKEKDMVEESAGDSKGAQTPIQSTGGAGDSTEDKDGAGELTTAEAGKVADAMRKQRDFLDGKVNKKSGTKSLTNKLKAMSKTNVEVQNVGGGIVPDINCLIYDLTGDDKVLRLSDVRMKMHTIRQDKNLSYQQRQDLGLDKLSIEASELMDTMPDGFGSGYRDYSEDIQKGTDMGALLGKKLQVRNEVRELVYNRMRTGHIDNKRLASAGYGIEGIFKQIHIDQYKKANLHISLDGSGSMSGEKWINTIIMTMAIAKAATYVQNLDIQVSLRVTNSSGTNSRTTVPVVVNCYDSRRNNLQQLKEVFNSFNPNSLTPEGLCFDAMIRRNMMITGGGDLDSYFLNISDGQPAGVNGYEGRAAIQHTQKQVNLLRKDYNMSILGFYMSDRENFMDSFSGQSEFTNFQVMYGIKDSKVVKATDAIGIAKALNEKFLAGSSKI